jgi:hypothetical protein
MGVATLRRGVGFLVFCLCLLLTLLGLVVWLVFPLHSNLGHCADWYRAEPGERVVPREYWERPTILTLFQTPQVSLFIDKSASNDHESATYALNHTHVMWQEQIVTSVMPPCDVYLWLHINYRLVHYSCDIEFHPLYKHNVSQAERECQLRR